MVCRETADVQVALGMMKILAALIVLSVAAGVRPADQVQCQHPVVCPCGNTGKDVKVCAEKEEQVEICSRWSRCKDCQDGLDGCLECPAGYEGVLCSKARRPERSSRQKRQFYVYQTDGNRWNSNSHQHSPMQQRGGGGCPELRSPKLGSIRCIYDDRQRTCAGKCLPGYSFEGHQSETEITLTCRGSYYTPLREFPPCKSGGHCDLIVQGSGSFNCTTGMTGTRCDVVCSGRYIGRYFCYPEQNWDPPLPRCVRPKDVQGVRQTCECQNGGSCDANGNCVCPAGTAGRFCEKTVPAKRTCSDPGFVENSVRRNPDESNSRARQSFDEGESVVYSCSSENYALQGSALLTCKNDGRWSSPLPKCIATMLSSQRVLTYCRDPGMDPNGGRNLQSPPSRRGFLEGSRLEYFCNPGYDVDGERSIFCLTSGRWSSGRPACKPNTRQPDVSYCINPGPIANGRIVYYPPLNGRRGGRPQVALDDPEYPEGGFLTYSCDSGYTLQGSDSITCGETGDWSAEPPVCRQNGASAFCYNPGYISNGRIVFFPPLVGGRRGLPQNTVDESEYPVGGLLLYFCDSGYTLQGSDSLTCRDNGDWSAEPPVCRRANPDSSSRFCRDPGVDPNGSRKPRKPPTRQGFPHGTRLEYSCNQGYELEGEKILFCLSSGDWLSGSPMCKPHSLGPEVAYCTNPGSIANGRVVYHPQLDNRRVVDSSAEDEDYPEGGRLQYSCDAGYNLQGSESITCQATGRWSSSPPVCNRAALPGGVINYCDNPGPIHNGKVEYIPSLDERRTRPRDADEEIIEYPQGSRLVYSCDIGYSLYGPSNITCEATGDWSGNPPTCITAVVAQIMYCFNPGPLLNGRIRYYPPMAGPRTGSTTLVAEDTPEYPEGTTLQYECDDGYNIEGSFTLRCHSTGLWSARPPKCTLDCGISYAGATRKILHGENTTIGEWPWVVAIAVPENGYSVIVCGGAVLNTRTVLTAAHCVNTDSQFTLYFGKHFRNNRMDDDQVQEAKVERIILHPDFNNVTFDSDIALLKFRPKIRYSTRVQPVCLPTGESTALNLDIGRSGYVTGWGMNENQRDSRELMVAHLPFQTTPDCLESFRVNAPTFNPQITQNMFCAGFRFANQSTCTGDSGSPLVFFDRITERHTIEGLVSYGIGEECGRPGMFTVFTKVTKFLPWIYRNMR